MFDWENIRKLINGQQFIKVFHTKLCIKYNTYKIYSNHCLRYNYTEHEFRDKKCSNTCQHKTKFVLILIKINLTLAEIYIY